MSADWWTPPWTVGGTDDPDAGWTGAHPSHEDEAALDDAGEWVLDLAGDEAAQVRSRDRVRELAEVFTHQREVDAILDSVADAFEDLDVKFLEPAAGSGNFLVEILRRKLRLVGDLTTMSHEQYEHRMLRAVASIYGVDISKGNITEARARMAHVMLSHYQATAKRAEPSAGFLNALGEILNANIVCGNTLEHPEKIEMCDWRPRPDGCFQRVWSFALVPPQDRDLFWTERVEDDTPIRYSHLSAIDDAAAERVVSS